MKSIIVRFALSAGLALATTQAKAEEGQALDLSLKACLNRIDRCESALDKTYEALEAERELATELERQNNRYQQLLQVTEQELNRKSAWYRDPAVVAPVSLVLGIVIGAKAIGSR